MEAEMIDTSWIDNFEKEEKYYIMFYPEKIKEIELTRGRLCIDFYPKSYLGGLFKIIPKKYILDFDNENNKSLIHKLIKNDIDKVLTRKNKSAVLKEILT